MLNTWNKDNNNNYRITNKLTIISNTKIKIYCQINRT